MNSAPKSQFRTSKITKVATWLALLAAVIGPQSFQPVSPAGASVSTISDAGNNCPIEVTSETVAVDSSSVSVSLVGTRCVVKFLTAGSYSVTMPDGVTALDYLVVGAGGGGGSGGGGAGGVLQGTNYVVDALGNYQISVGAGGQGGSGASGYAPIDATNGENSTFGTITAIGGGHGGQGNLHAGEGGSGGGSQYDCTSFECAGLGTPGQGTDGAPSTHPSYGGGAGGGGAGGSGGNTVLSHIGGNGGDGVVSSITGTPTWYGGGGGGGINSNDSLYCGLYAPGTSDSDYYCSEDLVTTGGGDGGLGGGGKGSSWGFTGGNQGELANGTPGEPNTGGGGGGTDPEDAYAYAGGSGIVVLSYVASSSYRTVTLNSNNNSGVTVTQKVESGAQAKLRSNPFTYDGYVFQGWNSQADGLGISYGNRTSFTTTNPFTLYAQWRAGVNHTVAFDGNGGTGNQDSQVAGLPTVLDDHLFVNPGYTFAGWNTKSNGLGYSYQENAVYAFDFDVNLYAQWTADKALHSVNFFGNGATSGTTSSQLANSRQALNENGFQRTGYNFLGWNRYDWAYWADYIDLQNYDFDQNMSLYAIWVPQSQNTVYFDGNGATSGSMPNQDATSRTLLDNNVFTRDGYSFLNWNTSSDGSGVNYRSTYSYNFGQSITLYAMWGQDFTVSYDGNGNTAGFAPNAQPATGGADAANLQGNTRNLSKTGYLLVGWNTAPDGTGTLYSLGQTNVAITGDVTLYAQWTPEQTAWHTASFATNGGSAVSAVRFDDDGGTVARPKSPTRSGYTFAGWSATDGGDAVSFPYSPGVAADITLYALWSANSHAVTFDSKSGSAVADGTFVTDGSLAIPYDPSRAGYSFLGWSATDGGSAVSFPYAPGVTSDITLYALWSYDSHSVTFDSKGGSAVDLGSFVTGGTVGSAGRLLDGVTQFQNGSNPGQGLEIGVQAQTSKITSIKQVHYYKFAGDDTVHTAHIWSADGTLLATQDFQNETASGWQTLILDNPIIIGENQNFTVSVWGPHINYTNFAKYPNATVGPITIIQSNIFNWGPSPTFPVHSYGDGFGVDFSFSAEAAPVTTRSGYTFAGWSATDGGDAVSFPYSPSVAADITLYALWSADSHAVTFDSKGGSAVADGTFVTDGSLALPYDPTRAGYSFLGWSATDGGDAISFPYAPGVTSDITLYALWSADTHTVTYDSKKGSAVSAGTFETDGYVAAISAPTRSGFNFEGWSATDGGSAVTFPYYPGATTDITLYALWTAKPALNQGPMVLEETTTYSGQQAWVPLMGIVRNITVDWGDGTVDGPYNSETGAWHNYATPGTYTVTVSGTELTRFGQCCRWNDTLTKVVSLGSLGITDLQYAFAFARNLQSVPETLPEGVTNLEGAFYYSYMFNQDLSGWDTSSVTSFNSMFNIAQRFNGDISNWDTSSATDMRNMFSDSGFNRNISNWDTHNVRHMGGMFRSSRFNNGSTTNDSANPMPTDGNKWDVSNVEDMNSLFENSVFNQDISNWDVSKVRSFNRTFASNQYFDQFLSNWPTSSASDFQYMFHNDNFNNNGQPMVSSAGSWDLSSAINLEGMFQSNRAFNQDISSWDISKATSLNAMFYDTSAYNNGGVPLTWNTSHITSMENTFAYARAFNADVSSWDMSNVETTSNMFYGNSAFQGNINTWDVSNVRNMNNMFSNSTFNQDIGSWDTSNVRYMSRMFADNWAFDQDISNWDLSSLEDMSWMFQSTNFNQPLDAWNVSNVTNMNGVFYNTARFNQPLADWNVSNVQYMASMFQSSRAFNQPLPNWNMARAITTDHMFYDSIFNGDVSNWNTSRIENMSGMFQQDNAFNQDITAWNVSNVRNFDAMFYYSMKFNQPIGVWDVSSATNTGNMFAGGIFNQPLNDWNVSKLESAYSMFVNNYFFNQDLDNWNTSNLNNSPSMFQNATSFNGDISTWNTSKLNWAGYMFDGATAFNQDISNWDVSHMNNFESMFQNAKAFNQPIGKWNVSNMYAANRLFLGASAFNQDLSSWNTGKLSQAWGMFYEAYAFNGNVSTWDTHSLQQMQYMFYHIPKFNQDLSNWNFSNVYWADNAFDYTGIRKLNYAKLLISLANQNLHQITIGFGGVRYLDTAAAAHELLSAPVQNGGKGWYIHDAGQFSWSFVTVNSLPTAADVNIGGTLADSSLTGGNTNVPGTWTFTDPTFAPTSADQNVSVTFTPDDDENYEPITREVNVHVLYEPRTISFTGSNSANWVKGTYDASVATSLGGGKVTYSVLSGTCSIDENGILSAIENGTCTFRATVANDGTYEAVSIDGSATLRTYLVTFGSNNGSAVDSQHLDVSGTLAEPAAPSRNGYTFLGWSETDGGPAVTFPYTPEATQDITLYALWSADSHAVTFVPNGGSTVADDSFVTDGTVQIPLDPTRAGYTFIGWSATDGGQSITFPYAPGTATDIALYALWSADSHSVTFDSKDGSAVTAGSFVTDGAVSAPSEPTLLGYTFDGWSATDGGPAIVFPYAPGVTTDITLYALWSITHYTVTYESNGGSAVSDGSFVIAESIDAPADPTRVGYTFAGWSLTAGGDAVSFPYNPGVATDITLYALWSADKHVVSFDSLNGSTVSDGSFVTDGVVELPYDPTRDGYTFVGWSLTDGGDALVFPYNPGVATEITLFALWSADSHVVSFDTKGGSAFPDSSFVTDGYVSIPWAPPYWGRSYRDGYTFLGWSATDGGSAISAPYYPGVATDITLYALWSADSHNIFFLANGSFVHYLSYVTDGSIEEPAAPQRTGYTFQGWSATDGGAAVSFPYSPGGTGFKVMYALWSADSHTVTFSTNGGSAVADDSFLTDGSFGIPVDPTRVGYTFLGWSASDGGPAVSFPYSPGVATDITLYASWSADSHSVNLGVNGGTVSFVTDGSIAEPAAPSRAGYTFEGWSLTDGGDALVFPYAPGVIEDLTFYPVWSADTHTVTFSTLGGSAVTDDSFVTDGAVGIPLDPTRTGYTFIGWSATDGGQSITFPYAPGVATDITLYALWSADTHTVNLGANGETVSFVTDGSIDEPAAPSRAGYTFHGWSLTEGGDALVFPYTPGVIEDLTFYPLWSADSHNVNLGSTGVTLTFVTDGSVAAPADPILNGYTFHGWSLTDSGDALVFPYTPGVSTDINFYPLWTADSHAVSFSTNGGSSVADDSFLTDGSLGIPVDPTRVGYTFLGWSATDGGQSITFPYTPAATTDITLYALWSADTHTINLGVNGGSVSFVTDGSIDEPAAPSRAGYTFQGWSLTDGGDALVFPFTPGVIEDLTFYPLWSADKHAVSFDSMGGSAVTDGSFVTDGAVELPYDPTRVGYTFLGWSATDGGDALTFPYAPGVATDITLYASWSADSHAVTFDSKSGSAVSDGSFVTDGVLSLPYDPTRDGYTFVGWSDTDGGYAVSFPYAPGVATDITLYALWSADSHVVSFDTKGGEAFPDGSFVTDGYVSIPWAPPYWGRPYRYGYTFLGWSATDGGSLISAPYYPGVATDITLYALWSADSHNILFFANGGYVHYLSYVTDGSIEEPAAPQRTGYTFAGWSATDGGDAVSFPYSPGGTGNKTMYALWSADKHSVSFDANGGSAVADDVFVTDGSVGIPVDPTRVGYTFIGWSATNGGSAVSFPYAPGVATDITLYSLWSADSHTITLGSNGGTVTFVTDGSIDEPAAPSRAGYTFHGWSLTEGGDALVFPYTPGVIEDLTFYPLWSADSHNVNLGVNGGTVSFVTDGSIDEPSAPSRAGYTFQGWSLTDSGDALVFPYTPGVIEDLTFYPLWSADSHTVNLGVNGGTVSFVTDGSIDEPAAPSRVGYTFIGWSATDGGDALVFPYAPGVATDITLYALFSADSHSVSFDANGGSVVADGSFVTDGVLSLPYDPTRVGYTFVGWSLTDGGDAVSFPYTPGVIEDINLYALWSADKHVVSFDSTSGTGVADGSFVTDGSVSVPAEPTRAGYTFAGWATTVGGDAIEFPYAPGTTEDISLYALWVAESHNVTFESNGGSAVDSDSFVTDGTVSAPVDPTREGYTFAGWSATDGGDAVEFPYATSATEDVTLYALWSADSHVVSFDSMGGSAVTDGSFVTDGVVSLPNDPTRTGYTFLGWSDTDGGDALVFPYAPDVIEDITLYALWSADSHTVNLGVYGGTVTFVTDGSIDEPSAPSRAGYTFEGWSLTAGGDALEFPYSPGVATDITLFALWSADSHAVTFNAKGGSAVTAGTFVTDGSLSAPAAPTRIGYNFIGWSVSDGGFAITFPYAPTATTNITLYALWSAKTYTVTFNTKNGSAVAPGSFTTGASIAAPAATSRLGYNFLGWSDYDGGDAVTFPYDPEVTSDITLYALWSESSYAVTFNSNGGTAVSAKTFVTGGSVSAPSAPTRTGYNFVGWSATEGGASITFPYAPGVTRNITLYAAWVKQVYTVNFSLDGGELANAPQSVSYTFGSTALRLPTPTRAHFQFDGWFDDSSEGRLVGVGSDAFVPTESTTLYAYWTQNTLDGIGSPTQIGSGVIADGELAQVTAEGDGNSILVNVPAGTLADETSVEIYLPEDSTKAEALLPDPVDVLVDVVVTWVGPDGEVSSTKPGSPVVVTITNPEIKAGDGIFQIVDGVAVLVGRATKDGSADITVTDAGQIVIAATAPTEPLTPTVTAGNGTATVSWSAPVTTGGEEIVSYLVTASDGQTCVSTTLTCTFRSLQNGKPLTFTVSAINRVGKGVSGRPTVSVTPVDPEADVAPPEDDGNAPPKAIDGSGKFVTTNDPTVLLSWDKKNGKLTARTKGTYIGHIQATITFVKNGTTYVCSAAFGTIKPIPAKTAAEKKKAALGMKLFTGKQFCIDQNKLDPKSTSPKGGLTKPNFAKIKTMKKTAAELSQEKLALAALKGFSGEVQLQVIRYLAWPTTMVNRTGFSGKGNKIPVNIRNTKVNLN